MNVFEHEQRRPVVPECLDEASRSEESDRTVGRRTPGLKPYEHRELGRNLGRVVPVQ